MTDAEFMAKIESVASKSGLKVLRGAGGMVLALFRYPDGRTQQVFIHRVGQLEGCEMVEIVSIAAEFRGVLNQEFANELLRENATHSVGYWGIIQGPDGQAMLGIHHSLVLDTLDPEELKIVVTGLGVRADAMEERLQGAVDDH